MVEKLPLILSIEKTLRRETNAEGWPVFGFEVKTQSGPAILRLTPAALDQLKEMLIKIRPPKMRPGSGGGYQRTTSLR